MVVRSPVRALLLLLSHGRKFLLRQFFDGKLNALLTVYVSEKICSINFLHDSQIFLSGLCWRTLW